ncbi:aspartic peptidase A1 [Lentinus tigrinus ALCF2SS1-7]|uniref:Aspartic peptidase A1 n=1 Tax=Lentinus tigrinus ALCF2SS1-6 TaxID=1328759 RepID=A0A5C2S9W5_9APHY|nr:aspartic peptidase A1 [Lentinus tigrinus ALCF2SS1-6]RPD75867.1 aspartic peptidase A1 [Lentinus tigrinus ALCF2SS1-7]
MPVFSLLVTPLLGFALFSSAFPLSPLSHGQGNNAADHSFVSNASPVTLGVARRFNSVGSSNVLKFDQARARALRQRTQTDSSSAPAEDADIYSMDVVSQVVAYVMEVGIGDPPQTYNLLVDTGSSNTWVGANKAKPFVRTPSSQFTGSAFEVQYGSGLVGGLEVIDTVTLAPGLTLHNQSIGVADLAKGFDGMDGILGRVDSFWIGPEGLTFGSFSPDVYKCVPTVTDTAWSSGLLDDYEVGISFRPSNTYDNKNGQLTFGGVDATKYTGELHYTPITSTKPASAFVGVDQSLIYGDVYPKVILDNAAGILDTGTTLILIASDAFERYQNVTGGVPDDDVGLLRITPEQYANLDSLYFNIGGEVYELIPNAQIWPRTLNEAIGGSPDAIYLIVNDLGSMAGGGLDFINGMSFLERFYMVYDVGGSRAGLAYTPWTYEEMN